MLPSLLMQHALTPTTSGQFQCLPPVNNLMDLQSFLATSSLGYMAANPFGLTPNIGRHFDFAMGKNWPQNLAPSPFSVDAILKSQKLDSKIWQTGKSSSARNVMHFSNSPLNRNAVKTLTASGAIDVTTRNNAGSATNDSSNRKAATSFATCPASKGSQPCHSSRSPNPDLHMNKSCLIRKQRTVYHMEQVRRLENAFLQQQYMVGSDRVALARQLGLSETQVRVWFQNRRSKWRKEMQDF